MSRIAAIALGLLATVQGVDPRAGPVIESGRDREIEGLFDGVGSGPTRGCDVPDMEVPVDLIRPEVVCTDGRRLVLELRHPTGDPGSLARTPSFEVFLLSHEGLDRERAEELARQVAARVSERDDGGFWHEGLPRDGGPVLSPVVLAVYGSFAGFCLLALGIAAWLLGRHPLAERTHRLAAAEMALLALGALLVRWWIVSPGPTNILVRLLDPRHMPGDLPQLGAGHAGWMIGWYGLLGVSDRTAFAAGAAAGALTVVPVYVLGWLGSGRRAGGIASAALLALWPMHALLTPSDEPSGLATLLTMTALALVCLAGRVRAGGPLVVLAWLSAGLAAQARVEYVLVLPFVCGLALAGRRTRTAQLRPLVLAATAALVALTVLGIWQPVAARWSGAPHHDSMTLEAALMLAGWRGGSILVPPRTHVLLTAAFLACLVPAVLATRLRAAAWLLCAIAVALPSAAMAAPSLVTSRYQLPIVAAASIVVGVGGVWLASRAAAAWPRAAPHLGRVIVAVPLCTAAWGIGHLPPRPTFQLEYDFFREHVVQIPPGCSVVIPRWSTDRGLAPPTLLGGLLDLDLEWIDSASRGDVEGGCVVYWRAASCASVPDEPRLRDREVLPSCSAVEDAYRLEPLWTADLPARAGFCDAYTSDPVTVGFYRLRPP